MFEEMVAIRGGGDLGSGVALRLWRSGFPVVVLEIAHPVAVRRTVAFSEAVYDGAARVEEAIGRLVSLAEVGTSVAGPDIPVLIDPDASSLERLKPFAVVDAILAKRNTGTTSAMAPVVIGLGPGFAAGESVHAVVETNRGPDLGRVIWNGTAQSNTGEPASVGGMGPARVLRAPASGTLRTRREIGDMVDEGEIVASVEGLPVRATFRALLRGLARDGLCVSEGMKICDIDPRLDPSLCARVSDKSLAIGGGVLEALLVRMRVRNP
jgi:xanthine dehydrogenase accessory factor